MSMMAVWARLVWRMLDPCWGLVETFYHLWSYELWWDRNVYNFFIIICEE